MRQDYLERRDMIVKGFQDMGLPIAVPEGAFYVFPDISQTGLSDEDFCEQLLEQQHVAVVPGSASAPAVLTVFAVPMHPLREPSKRHYEEYKFS